MKLILDPSDPIDLDFKPFTVDDLSFDLARKRPDWISSESSDGAVLFDDPLVDVLLLTARLRVDEYSDRDDAVGQLRQVLAKLDDIEKRRPDGMEVQWTDKDSSVTTSFYALMGELTELPMDTRGGDVGWYHKAPLAIVELTCKPFGYGASATRTLYDSDPFNRDTLSEGRWLVDSGSGFSVSGGQLVPASTTLKRLYRQLKTTDLTATLKFTTGSTLTSSAVGVMAKRLDSSNYLIGEYDHATTSLRIRKVDGGAESTLGSTASYTVSANTSYWLRLVVTGNVVTLTIYTADPEAGAAAAQTATFTLITGDATKFGSGIYGYPGFRATPGDTSHRYDDWLLKATALRSGGAPILDFEVRDTPGDVDAEPVLTVTDKSTQARRHFELGLEHEDYSPADPQPPLVDSDQMVSTGGSSTTRTGAYDPLAAGNSVIRATLVGTPIQVLQSNALTHIGRFRPKARVYATSRNQVYMRLAYMVGDGPWGANPWQAIPFANDWCEVDLGAIDIPRTAAGSQRWFFRIEAFSKRSDGTLDTLDVDYVVLQPAKRWMKARAKKIIDLSGLLSGRSEFTTESGAITGDALSVGGANVWTVITNSDADDFSAAAGVATRTAVSDAGTGAVYLVGRAVTVGTTAYTAIAQQIDFKGSAVAALTWQGLIARAVDSSNYMVAVTNGAEFRVGLVVAGAATNISETVALQSDTWYTIKLAVAVDGSFIAQLGVQGYTVPIVEIVNQSSVLATSGVLDDGRSGIIDYATGATANTRTYDNYMLWVPIGDVQAVIQASRQLEITHERTERYDITTGTFPGPVQEARGSRLWLPPAGDRDLVTRIVTKARRNDVDTEPDTTLTDEHEVSLSSRPRYRFPADS